MSESRPPHPHDHLFRSIFSEPENALALLEDALPPALLAAIDRGSLTLQRETFIDDTLAEARHDLLFTARFADRPALVYFLFEHQRTVDPLMPYRVLRYVLRVWE